MTSKLIVNELAADTGISTITVGDNMSGVTFKTGTSNLHNVGIEIAGINVLGADTPIGAGATIYNSGDVIVGGAITATTFSGSGASLTGLTAGQIPNLAASKITSGTVATARLGSGTANSSSFLRGDQTWAAVTSTTINNNATTKFITGTNNANELDCEANLSYNNSVVTFASSNLTINKSTNPTISVTETSGNKSGQFRTNTDGVLIRSLGNYPLIFHTNQSEKLRIDSDGDLWHGLTPVTHHNNRHAFFHNASDNFVSITSGSGATAGIVFGDSAANTTANYESYIAHYNVNNSLYLYTGQGTKGLELKSGGDASIIDGNLVLANGHGIDFSATGGGTGTSNANEILTDYEHGEWTPVLQHYIGGGFTAPTYSTAGTVVGRYTKIGNMVHISASFLGFNISNAHGSSFARITGLPFTSTNHPNHRDVMSCASDAFTSNGVVFATYWNQTNLNSMKHGSSVFDWGVLLGGSTDNIVVSGHYTAA